MQLFNVYHGGTLIFDIPSVTNISGHAKVQGNYNAYLLRIARLIFTENV